jgi:hypothetical protein
MMRRLVATLATALALLAVFGVLALRQRQSATGTAQATRVVLVRTASGALVPVAAPSAAGVHATTSSSGAAPASGTGTVLVRGAGGSLVSVNLAAQQPAAHATTQTS